MAFVMGGILGTAFDHGGTCLGGVLASFGVANWSTKRYKNKISHGFRWPPNNKYKCNNQPKMRKNAVGGMG